MSVNTLNSITTEIASHLKKETDEVFKRMLAQKVDHWRSTLLGRSLVNTPSQRRLFAQTIIVPMELVEAHECVPCLVGKVARSVDVVPVPLRSSTIMFDYIGAVDGNSPFGIASQGTASYLSAGRYSKNILFPEYVNGKIQIQQRKLIPKIMITSVFDEPFKVMEFNCKTSGQCDYWNSPYPATNDIIQMIVQYILQIDYGRPVVPNDPQIEVNNPEKQEI